jgi:hypothetical protein
LPALPRARAEHLSASTEYLTCTSIEWRTR